MPAWLAQKCACIAQSHNFSDELPLQATCTTITKGRCKQYPENDSYAGNSYSHFPSDRFRAMIKPMPQNSPESKGKKIPGVAHKVWGYDAQTSYSGIKSSCKSVALQ